MEDKTFRKDSPDRSPILDLDGIEDPVARKEFEEMEQLIEEIKSSGTQTQITIYVEPRRRFLFF